jgi:hypothetical protein|tara:strand:+ start:44 stop:586 length:543 start_codon:yes stop_codon:yes gene_type:complete
MINDTNNIRTLHGIAEFCWLTEADTKFNPKGIYHVDLRVKKEDADPEVKAINEAISKEIAEEHKKTPGKTGLMKRAPLPFEKQSDGSVIFKIKSQYKPKIWDRNKKELSSDTSVWKDSTMWVRYKTNAYNQSIGIGCTLYLQCVQIDNLVEGSGGVNGSCPFPERGSVLPTHKAPPKELY